MAYDRLVVLQNEFGELRLLPITSTGIRLLLPFQLSNGSGSVEGRLELIVDGPDPLPLLIDRNVSREDAIRAWVCALIGFADATCIEIEPKTPRQRSAGAPSRPAGHQRRAPVPPAPRQRAWPSHLDPVGNWVQYSGSFVAGHRRQLDEGRTASDEAIDRARQVGIILRAHETWVRPHSRGVPENVEMRFRWHAPGIEGLRGLP